MLTAEKRLMVAEAVTGQPHEWKNPWSAGGHDVLFMVGGGSWRPEEDVYQWNALTRKCAELIVKLRETNDYWFLDNDARVIKFIDALATNNTDAIEQLVYELITGEKA